MIFGNPVRGVIRPINWHRPQGNHEPKLTRGYSSFHDGLDISFLRSGDPIIAAEAGIVFLAGFVPDGALDVVIDHGPLRTLYGHLRSESVKVGQKVRKGEVIGRCGNTGVSTAPHLHFSVFTDSGVRRDPWPLLEQNQPDITVHPKNADGIRIRREAKVNGAAYAETDAGSIVRFDGRNLGPTNAPRKWGGTVDGGPWTLPNGQTGRKWERIWLDSGYRHIASGLAVVSK